MAAWAKKGLAEWDYAHLTRQGSMVLGELYFKALMKGFADWLASPQPTSNSGDAPQEPAEPR